jgi:carboxyl-terminal processing protease
MNKGKPYLLAAVLIVGGLALLGNRADAEGDRFYSDLTRLDKVVTKITESYVEEVSSKELVDAAIGGMRGILDPHTAYFEAKDYEDLKISTDGEFGGLGIQIGIRDQVLTVVSPLSGTPAHRMGLRAGDQITRIDTLDTRGITVDEAVGKLRGKPGTKVTIRIRREGVANPLDYTITREIIKIESVPYAAMLNDSIGYVKVTQFSRTTASDLEAKIRELKKRGNPKGLVLDLRTNPGGLLNQAVEVSELFLEKGLTVVQTKGRVRGQNQEYRSGRAPLWTGKLAVLVNGSSASAAEIVAGALQDWDRGVLLGGTTFGKGSVQTVQELDRRGNALKLTTAHYYTPSGRNINKPENGRRGRAVAMADAMSDGMSDGMSDEEGEVDSAAAAESAGPAKAPDTAVFRTRAGRAVRAAGGVTPDVVVPERRISRFVLELFRKNMFFTFAVKHRTEITAGAPGGTVSPGFEVPSAMVEEFRAFVFADTAFSRFRGAAAVALEQSREAWRKERADRGDTAGSAHDRSAAEFDRAYGAVEGLLRAEAEREFTANLDFIRRELKAEILGATSGEEARTAHELRHDAQVSEALRYLGDNRLYAAALRADVKSAKAK